MKPKNILLIVSCATLIIISLSIAYYFVVFLPQYKNDLKKIQQDILETKESINNIESNTHDIQAKTDYNTESGYSEGALEDIKNSLREQEWGKRTPSKL